MRKSLKRIAAVSMAACLACSSLAACSKENEGDAKATEAAGDTTEGVSDTKGDETEGSTEDKNVNEGDGSAETTKEQVDETTKESSEGSNPGSDVEISTENAQILLNVLEVLSAMDTYNYEGTMSIALGELLSDMGLTDTTAVLGYKGAVDMTSYEYYLAVTAALKSAEMEMSFDLANLAMLQDASYIDLSSLVSVAATFLGGTDVLDAVLAQYGLDLTSKDFAEVLSVSLPIGSKAMISDAAQDAYKDVQEAAYTIARKVLANLSDECSTVKGDTYIIEFSGETAYYIIEAIAKGIEQEDVENLYDAYVAYIEAYDVSGMMDSVEKLRDEIYAGIEALDVEISAEEKAEFEDSMDEAISDISEELQQMVAELKAEKDDTISELMDGINEMKDAIAEDREACKKEVVDSYNEALADSGYDVQIKLEISAKDGVQGAATLVVADPATGESYTIDISYSIEKGAVSIKAPEKSISLSKFIERVGEIVLLFSELNSNMYY